MGGSGGSSDYTHRAASADPTALRQQAEAELQNQELSAGINEYLSEVLAEYNDRDTDNVKDRLDQIASVLEEVIAGVDRLLFGGSIAKHTYVDGLSDVDALLILKGPQSGDASEVIESLARTLRERLPSSGVAQISAGRLAVTVSYTDGTQIQLLPAREDGNRLAIASEDGHGWRSIRPRRFAAKLTQVNQQNNGGVVPSIKLAKALLERRLPEGQRLSGYHIEAIAVDAFKGYHGPTSREAMLRHLVHHASRAVLKPTGDITGQTVHIDQHLGPAGSAERKRIAVWLRRVDSLLKSAGSVESYQSLFE